LNQEREARSAQARREREEKAKAAKAAAQVEEERIARVAIAISAPDLLAEYESNQIAADQAYKGKWLAVRGAVLTVGRDLSGNRYVALKGKKPVQRVHRAVLL
jgi:hypothetical protein